MSRVDVARLAGCSAVGFITKKTPAGEDQLADRDDESDGSDEEQQEGVDVSIEVDLAMVRNS